MIAECKRIRTRKGDPMMFATLDDLEGQVELLVFNSAYAENEDKVDVDKLVIVRGRVDHKEEGEIKLVAQEVERFDPSEEEVARARRRRSPRRSCGGSRLHVSQGVPPASWRTSSRSSSTTPASTSCCCPWASGACCSAEFKFRVDRRQPAVGAGAGRSRRGAYTGRVGQAPPERRQSCTSAASAARSATASSTPPAA